ncbi:MAG TPA: hypothetical protein VF761_16690 [Gemmatimonadaceae bacterium]
MQEPTITTPVIMGVDPAGPEGDRTVVRAFPRAAVEQLSGISGDAEEQPIDSQTAADRINSSLPPVQAKRPNVALMKKWSADPVKFAHDIGVKLDREEAKVLRRAMRGDMPTGRRKKDILEAVRVKIENALQRIHEADTAGTLVRPQAVPSLEPEVSDGGE